MSKVFLPGCKVKAKFKYQSDKLQAYLEQKEGVQTVGCCKAFCSQVAPTDIAVVICNNCAAIMEESSAVSQIEFVWNIIDNDPEFPFPDYHGERIVVQDCWRAYEKRYVQDAVRSLMRKMNIVPVELQNNYEKADFCGADLLEPCTDIEKKFAPKRYAVNGANMYKPIPKAEEDDWLRNYCSQITEDKVVCYCMACLDGINRGGKTGKHLLELLFPEN